jgi:putative membrane protein
MPTAKSTALRAAPGGRNLLPVGDVFGTTPTAMDYEHHSWSQCERGRDRRIEIMKRVVILLGSVLLVSPVFAQSMGEKTGVNSVLGIAPATADFVKEVAISDMFEIESSKLAEQKGNAQEKSFAQQMITDHTKTSTELKQLVSSGKVKEELPSALDSSHQSKLDKLKDASGRDFSSDFDSDQVSAHKDAVSLFERYAKSGDNADLKDWAGKTLPTLQHHLDMAQELGKAPSVGQSSK